MSFLGKSRNRRKIKKVLTMSKNQLFIIIIGCGRLGSFLANRLSRDGQNVVIIDINKARFENLSAEFSGFRIEGDATETAVLIQAKINKADAMIAATHEDNVNLMIAQIAKRIYKVPKVMARIFDLKREEIFRRLGIETISPTSIAGDIFLKSLQKVTIRNKTEKIQ